MSVSKIISYLHTYPPRYGPEWGSGGIYGLKYYRRMLYYTLAFEGEAHFIKDYDEQIYKFQMLGKGPTSGGDTYNAVETVDEFLYFGGWVHAPAMFKNRKISFKNKYSHIHEYNIDDDYLKLLWKDSIHHPTQWAGEVSDILYDPYNDRLVIARQDGEENLGIYGIDRNSGEAERLYEEPALKGEIVHDSMFFTSSDNYKRGLLKILNMDLIDNKWTEYPVEDVPALDGEGIIITSVGDVASLNNRLFTFTRGGILIGNPLNGESFRYVRVFDFFTFQSPMRSNALYIRGGVLIPYNTHHDAIYKTKRVEDRIKSTFSNTIAAPTLLLYVAPPMIKIVGVFGARITSMESIEDKIIIGTNTTPNVGAEDATPYDSGYRGFTILDQNIIDRPSPPVSISIPLALISLANRKTKHSTFGGVPLDGYKEPRLVIYASKNNQLTIYEYDLSLPLNDAYEEKFTIVEGKNIVDLSSFSGIVSFSLKKEDFNGKVRIELS